MIRNQQKSDLEIAHEVIGRLNRMSLPSITTEEMVERGLLFAKTDPSVDEIAQALVYFHYKGIATQDLSSYLENALIKNPTDLHNWWRQTESQREDFQSRLTELIHAPQRAIRERAASDRTILGREMLITCTFDESGDDRYRFYPMTVEAGYKYVLQVLYRKSDWWRRVRQCALPDCKAFFLRKVSELGGRPRDYCTPECQLKADGKKALKRQKKQRRLARQTRARSKK